MLQNVPKWTTELNSRAVYLLMFFGAAGRRQLSLVDELLRQFTKRLTDTQTSRPFITDGDDKAQRRSIDGNCSSVGRKGNENLA